MNIRLAGLIEKGKFIGPEIGVVAFHIGVVSDVTRPRGRQRQKIGAQRAFVSGAIGPKGTTGLPIRAQAFVMCDRILDDESFDAIGMGQDHAKTHRATVILHV